MGCIDLEAELGRNAANPVQEGRMEEIRKDS